MSFEFVQGINATAPMAIVEKADDAKSTEEHMADYIESMRALEEEMEPYKEQKRELKKEYLEKKWLTKEDISLSVRALRLLKDDVDIAALLDMYNGLKDKHGKDDE